MFSSQEIEKVLLFLKKGAIGSKNAYLTNKINKHTGAGFLWAPAQSTQGQNPASYVGHVLAVSFPSDFLSNNILKLS